MDWDWWEETGGLQSMGSQSQTGLTHHMSQEGVSQSDVSAQRLLKKKKNTATFTKSGSNLNKTISEYEYFSHGILESSFTYQSI